MMKVSNIKELKNCVSINIDRVTFKISKQVYLEYNLFDGKEIDLNTLTELKNRDDFIKCQDYLNKLISSCIYSEYFLMLKAINKGYKEETVKNVITLLKKYGYHNDKDNINDLINLYIIHLKSNKDITNTLLNKGFKENDVIYCLNEYSNEEERIKKLYSIFLEKNTNVELSSSLIEKFVKKLVNKGYDYIDIEKVIGIHYGDFD